MTEAAVANGFAHTFDRALALSHSGRSFLEHLYETSRVLAAWGMPASVCRAGFLHSAYATSFYPHALFDLSERDRVRRLIGREAESLVYRFCTMDRRGYWDMLAKARPSGTLYYADRVRNGAPVRISLTAVQRLLMIESANVAEQSKAPDGGPAPWMSRLFRWWRFLDCKTLPVRLSRKPALSRYSEEAAIGAYAEALQTRHREAARLFALASQRNPFAGEPRILRALCAPVASEAQRQRHLRTGAALLSAWATPWDKRLSLQAWLNIARRCENRSRHDRFADFETIAGMLTAGARPPRWLRLIATSRTSCATRE
ncbi:MAG TPA: hypothetical protein VED01_18600 [Burkholderiales bacterium]|nr:hypothetical protein [Burkholderiales bacterium]